MKIVTLLTSALLSLILMIGCADRTERQLSHVQKELEQMFRTALLDGDIKMQRVSDHLTVMIAERLLFDGGSHEATNETEEGRQLNRRIEIVLYAGV